MSSSYYSDGGASLHGSYKSAASYSDYTEPQRQRPKSLKSDSSSSSSKSKGIREKLGDLIHGSTSSSTSSSSGAKHNAKVPHVVPVIQRSSKSKSSSKSISKSISKSSSKSSSKSISKSSSKSISKSSSSDIVQPLSPAIERKCSSITNTDPMRVRAEAPAYLPSPPKPNGGSPPKPNWVKQRIEALSRPSPPQSSGGSFTPFEGCASNLWLWSGTKFAGNTLWRNKKATPTERNAVIQSVMSYVDSGERPTFKDVSKDLMVDFKRVFCKAEIKANSVAQSASKSLINGQNVKTRCVKARHKTTDLHIKEKQARNKRLSSYTGNKLVEVIVKLEGSCGYDSRIQYHEPPYDTLPEAMK